MATTYTETPDNLHEIEASVITEINEIKRMFYQADRVFFYDACSFQRHSNLKDTERNILIQYFEKQGVTIFLTRCILMELSGNQHSLERRVTDYIKSLNDANIRVILFNEEYAYNILSDCFSSIERINEYLMWAVRMVCSPVSTIADTLKADSRLNSEVREGKKLKASNLYQRFFSAVRGNKEHEDDLGEEMIAICVHLLSNLPGVADGKLCVLTDDKGAASKIDSVMKKASRGNQGTKIIIFSTPKLVQHMFWGHVEMSENEMINIISQGVSGNIGIMGLTDFDLEVNPKISLSVRDLAQKIMEPNGIKIVF
ncbi:hypothetical protein [Selenomonas ruminantium]|uniref:PIN domain-containing protein n=1 Tax=Selenomonas ruminantium TaxID=971 RepID=A0A1H0S3S9_SELRU|nr:hypothetical protein [Selenomonas ruminantium]SDP36413.1 hypothetical protein SAMN05216366_11549 [Selenomonas ruminantium]